MIRGAIDIGNSNIKTALFDANGVILDVKIVDSFKNAYTQLKSAGALSIICSSVADETRLSSKPDLFYLKPDSKLPFENLYLSMQTLG